MSKILITGNGFDLFHHLPTKYHHFISIMETIEKFQPSKEATFEDLFGRIFKDKYLDDYNSIIDNYNVKQIKFDNSKIKQIDELLKTNLWYKHFKNVCEIETWIDFEMEIENILNQLAIFSEIDDKISCKKNIFQSEIINCYDFKLLDIISVFKVSGSFKINEKYINQRINSINIKKILEDLAKSFEEFIVIFNRYLIDVVSVFYTEIKKKSAIPFNLMDEIYTFNYTFSLERFYNVDKSKVVYLHGKIDEDSTKQNLVLGVSEISKKIKEVKAFDFTKYYQRIKKNSNKKFIEIPKNEKSGLNETIFYIIGHSLDASDKEYVDDLFKFLKYDLSEYSKICMFYHNEKDKENKLKNLFSIIDKNIIIEMNKTNRLYFVDLNEENINNEFSKHTYMFTSDFRVF